MTKFQLDHVVATPAALEAIEAAGIAIALEATYLLLTASTDVGPWNG